MPLCYKCFEHIRFVNRNGENVQINSDGSDHRDSCSPPQSTPTQASNPAKKTDQNKLQKV